MVGVLPHARVVVIVGDDHELGMACGLAGLADQPAQVRLAALDVLGQSLDVEMLADPVLQAAYGGLEIPCRTSGLVQVFADVHRRSPHTLKLSASSIRDTAYSRLERAEAWTTGW